MRTREIEKVLNDFSASDWLKRALLDAMNRDAVDAANDADVLAHLLRDRCDEIRREHENMIWRRELARRREMMRDDHG